MFRDSNRQFSSEEEALLVAISEQLSVAVENARLLGAAQDAATLEERKRLARELHDSVSQLIYGDMLMAAAGREMVACRDLARADHYLAKIRETAQQALKEMRLLLFELRPSGLPHEGLVDALQRRLDAVERRGGVAVQLLVDGPIDLPPPVEEELQRIAQEALNNALKHAAATSITIELRASGSLVEMKVSDDGRGFCPSAYQRGGLGLTTMRERAERLGGALVVESPTSGGTVVHVRVELGTNPSDEMSNRIWWSDLSGASIQ